MPVHEGTSCLCVFLSDDRENKGWYPILRAIDNTRLAINILIGINVTSFYLVNWMFLLINIYAIFRIRKMKDKLDIRRELMWAVGIWSSFDFLQYTFYYLSQYADCDQNSPTKAWLAEHSSLFSYIVIILRDFVTHCSMVYFIFSVNRREDNIKSELEKDDSPHDLHELKTVLNSCRPLICFSSWLEENRQAHIVLLEYIKSFETIKE